MNDKDFKRNRKEFELELKTLIKKNENNIFYEELAKDYLLKLKKINNLDDLNVLRQKFIKDLSNLDYRIKFFKLKKSFKETLSSESNNNPNDIEIQELIEEYERKLFDISTLEKLNLLIKEFENSLNKLHSIKDQEMLNRKKAIFLNNLISVENSYFDQETIELLDFCRKKLLEIKTFNDLDELEKLFNEKFKKIRNYENSIFKFKEELKRQFLSYLDGIYKEEYQELVDDYLNMLKERESFKELRELEESFNAEVVLLQKEITRQEEEFKNSKEKNKKFCLGKFYLMGKSGNYGKIIQSKEILVKLLQMLDKTTFRDIDAFTIFLSRLSFTNLTEDLEKIKFFEFSKNDKVKILNQEYFDARLSLNSPINEDIEKMDNNLENIKNKVLETIFKMFHSYAIKCDIETILETLDNLMKILDIINTMSEEELKDKYQAFINIDFNDINKTNNLLKSLKTTDNIYINSKTGQLCTVTSDDKDAYLKFINEDDKIYMVSREEFDKEYISLREFFENATFVDGRVVNEKIDEFNTYEPLFMLGQEYLYCYKNLMLVYYGDGFGKESNSLKFITTDKGYEWNLTGGRSRNEILNKFSDKDLCEDVFNEQVQNEIDFYNRMNQYKIKVSPIYALPSFEEDAIKKI